MGEIDILQELKLFESAAIIADDLTEDVIIPYIPNYDELTPLQKHHLQINISKLWDITFHEDPDLADLRSNCSCCASKRDFLEELFAVNRHNKM